MRAPRTAGRSVSDRRRITRIWRGAFTKAKKKDIVIIEIAGIDLLVADRVGNIPTIAAVKKVQEVIIDIFRKCQLNSVNVAITIRVLRFGRGKGGKG